MKLVSKIILILFTVSLFTINSVSAESYEGNIGLEFTLNPVISINISGNLTIDNLAPGDYKDSNIIAIGVETNNISGCTLTTTAGTKTSNTDLTNIVNNNYKFVNLDSGVTNISDFSDNTWGYSYCSDTITNCNNDNTKWVSGSVGSTNVGYNGLPQDNNDNVSDRGKGGVVLMNTDSPTDATLNFKIAAKASNTQLAGEYTNVINFYAVTKPTPVSFYDAFRAAGKEKFNGYYKMQDMTHNICSAVEVMGKNSAMELIDIRDGQIYTIAKLYDDNCWMVDNLNLGDVEDYSLIVDTLNSSNTNIDIEIDVGDFRSWEKSSGTSAYATPEYITVSGIDAVSQTIYGTLYNYCAASAKTYCMPNGAGYGDAEYDICPSGWRLPTGGENGEFFNLYNNSYNSIAKIRASIFDDGAAFALAGSFDISPPSGKGSYSRYWSSTYSNGTNMCNFVLSTSSIDLTASGYRYYGRSVRCLAK